MPRTLFVILTLTACAGAPNPGGSGGFGNGAGGNGGGSGGSGGGGGTGGSAADHCPELAPIAVVAGGRVSVPMAGIDTATITSLPEAFVILDQSPGVLTLRAPWAPGDATLGLDLRCGTASASAQVSIQVASLRWTTFPSWTPDQNGPLGREYFTFWIDEGNPDRALVYGGFHYVPMQFTVSNDLWSLDLTSGAWTRLPEPLRSPGLAGGAVAPVPGERSMLWYGGLAVVGGSNRIPFALSELHYAAQAPDFTPRQVTPTPNSGTYQPMWFYDEPRGRYLAVCGADPGGYRCAVKSYDPTAGTWTTLATAGDLPAGRDGTLWTHDVENQRLVMFSGDRGTPDGSCDCVSETWTLELAENPPRWVKLNLDNQPEGRRNGGFALDPEGERFFLWGGTPDGMNAAPSLWALDLARGKEAWHKLDLPDEPPARASDGAVFDAARHRILFGFGNSLAATYADMYALDLNPAR